MCVAVREVIGVNGCKWVSGTIMDVDIHIDIELQNMAVVR